MFHWCFLEGDKTACMKRLTIFTPTYNRAYILPELYESLRVQTCKDFEWLVVDDGSTDNTHELVEQWEKEGEVDIRYFFQQNGGKMRATNLAAKEAKSELFVCIDSDDQLIDGNVVHDSLDFWDHRASVLKESDCTDDLCGMISRRRSPKVSMIDDPGVPFVGTACDITSTYRGETTIFTVTDILRKYPYPEFEGETFITDIYIYDAMSEKYKFLYHPYYSQFVDYMKDGYTMSFRKVLLTNPRGHREHHRQRIRLKRKGYWKSAVCNISLSLFIHDHTLFSQSPNLPLTILLYPIGCLKHVYDRYMLWREK